MTFLTEFGLLFIIIVVFAFIIKLLRQPIIIGYVLSGLFFALFLGRNSAIGEQMELFASLGITFLLFLMGLEFDLRSLRYLGKDLIISAVYQSIIYFCIGFLLSLCFPFTWFERTYIAIIFMFCSTLLVAKWLDDKKESGTLYGKLTLGTLIIQDVIAIVAMTLLSISKDPSGSRLYMIPLNILLLIFIGFILSRYVLNFVLRIASKYAELMFIFSLSICFIFVELAQYLGISESIGAFIGGVVIANTIYKSEVATRLKPLLIFFNMLFFVGLGFQIDTSIHISDLAFAIAFIALSIFVKPIITYLTLRERQFDIKTSALSSLQLASMSEFGIIIIIAGIELGLIGERLLPIAIISGIGSMILGSYIIKYDRKFFQLIEKPLRKYDKLFAEKDGNQESAAHVITANVVFFGFYEFGRDIYRMLKERGKSIVVIDSDPEHIEQLTKENIPHIYSSSSDPEFFEHHTFSDLQLVVSSNQDKDENKIVLERLKGQFPSLITILSAKNVRDSVDLYDHGADYVIYPSYVNEQQVSVLLEEYSLDANKLIQKKIADMDKFKSNIAEKDSASNAKFLDIDQFFSHISQVPTHLHKMQKDFHKEFEKNSNMLIFNMFNKHKTSENQDNVDKTQKKEAEK